MEGGERKKMLVSISSDTLINPPLPNIIRHVDPRLQSDSGHF